MQLVTGVIMMLVRAATMAQEQAVAIVPAPDSPVHLERATLLSTAGAPPVLLYAAQNLTNDPLDEFTVMAFIFKADGVLKARQVAPGRRTLDVHETKYSTMVLDGSPIEPGESIVVGVNQAQRVNSNTWWRADLQAAAEALVRKKP